MCQQVRRVLVDEALTLGFAPQLLDLLSRDRCAQITELAIENGPLFPERIDAAECSTRGQGGCFSRPQRRLGLSHRRRRLSQRLARLNPVRNESAHGRVKGAAVSLKAGLDVIARARCGPRRNRPSLLGRQRSSPGE